MKPTKVTKDTITDAQIEALQIEAAIAGDKAMVETCEKARGDFGSAVAKARCADAMNEVASQY